MLILADGADVRDLVPSDPRIRLIHLEPVSEIGPKRNFGCERAQGEIVAHWDDDDYSAPDRLEDQVSRLLQSGKAVTGYRTMRFTDGARWWMYDGSPLYALGTSLCYRREWWEKHRFPSVQVGEDNEFVTAAAAKRDLIVSEAGDRMHATIHAGNTSVRKTSGSSWKQIT